MADLCDIIQTTPEFRKDDGSDDYVDNATALSLLITLTGADVFNTSVSCQLPYEFVGNLQLHGMQKVLWKHMTEITHATYKECLWDSQGTYDATDDGGMKLLKKVYSVEKGLGQLVVSFIRPLTKLLCDK